MNVNLGDEITLMESIMPDPTKAVQLYAHGRISKYGLKNASWSCHLQYGRFNYKSLSGDASSHSQNRMELVGIIAGLKALKYPCIVEIKTANEYIWDCGERLLYPKASDSFVGAVHKSTAKNCDLWRQFEDLKKIHRIRITSEKIGVLCREVDSARYDASQGPFIPPTNNDSPQEYDHFADGF